MSNSFWDHDPSLPPVFDHVHVKEIFVPESPHKVNSTGYTVVLDIRPLFVISDQNLNWLLSHIPAWYSTLYYLAWKVGTYAKVKKGIAINNAISHHGCTAAQAKSDHIHTDPDYVKVQDQAEWLDRMAKAVHELLFKGTQTYSANRRREYDPGMAPAHTEHNNNNV